MWVRGRLGKPLGCGETAPRPGVRGHSRSVCEDAEPLLDPGSEEEEANVGTVILKRK